MSADILPGAPSGPPRRSAAKPRPNASAPPPGRKESTPTIGSSDGSLRQSRAQRRAAGMRQRRMNAINEVWHNGALCPLGHDAFDVPTALGRPQSATAGMRSAAGPSARSSPAAHTEIAAPWERSSARLRNVWLYRKSTSDRRVDSAGTPSYQSLIIASPLKEWRTCEFGNRTKPPNGDEWEHSSRNFARKRS